MINNLIKQNQILKCLYFKNLTIQILASKNITLKVIKFRNKFTVNQL